MSRSPALAVPCGYCRQPAGFRCRVVRRGAVTTRERTPHRSRWDAYRAAEATR